MFSYISFDPNAGAGDIHMILFIAGFILMLLGATMGNSDSKKAAGRKYRKQY